MSVKDFTANVISATPIVPDGNFQNSAASGVWDLSEHFDLVKGSNWPTIGNVAPIGLFGGGGNGAESNVSCNFHHR